MNSAKIYSRNDCPYCDLAKNFLMERGIPFEEIMIGRDLTREEFKEQFPEWKTVPQIYLDDQYIGGYGDLVFYFDGVLTHG